MSAVSDDSFLSIDAHTTVEIKVSGSRFIAEALPVASENEAEAEIARIREREHAATHHCTAYRIGADGERFRYNDDGEPSGTAGPPILRQIDGRNLTNVLVVVTRYYGGTKLGTGGLARAYSEAASEALDAAKTIQQVITVRVNVSFVYDDTSPAMHTVERFGARVVETAYSNRTEMTVAVRRSRVDAFIAAFTDALGGRGDATREEVG